MNCGFRGQGGIQGGKRHLRRKIQGGIQFMLGASKGLKAVRSSNQSFDSNLVNFCPIFKIFFLLKACENRHLFKPEGRAKGRRRRPNCEFVLKVNWGLTAN